MWIFLFATTLKLIKFNFIKSNKFLKGQFQCGLWNHITNLSHSVILKSMYFEWIILLVCDFVTLCFGHLESIGSLSYTELPNVDIAHCIISQKKSRLLISPLISSEKSFSVGKLSSSQWQIQVFQTSSFRLKTWILSLATNAISYFP